MKQVKRETSTSSDIEFPKGDWILSIREDVEMGYLRFTHASGSPEQYYGSMQFENNSNFGNIAGDSFSVDISFFSSETGVIVFQILDAALLYDSTTPPPYRFVFEGFFDPDKPSLSGIAKVPQGFGESGGPGDEGDVVGWTAEAHGGMRRKRSK